MEKILFDDRRSLMLGLKKFGRAIVLVTCLSSGFNEVIQIRDSAENIIHADASYSTDFPLIKEGRYSLESTDDEAELDYEAYALAITFEASLKNSNLGLKVGNLTNLKSSLSEYDSLERIGDAKDTKGLVRELITKILDEESRLIDSGSYPAGYYWVPMPNNPEELKSLENTLLKEAVFYAFPNGRGTIDKTNLKQGGGLMKLYS